MFFFNDTATTEIYTLSLHDALPILVGVARRRDHRTPAARAVRRVADRVHDRLGLLAGVHHRHDHAVRARRSEEHTSELQSRQYLVCRLLLEKNYNNTYH